MSTYIIDLQKIKKAKKVFVAVYGTDESYYVGIIKKDARFLLGVSDGFYVNGDSNRAFVEHA